MHVNAYADTAQCPLKNAFAEKIYLLAQQVQAVCSENPESVLAKIAAKQLADECLKNNSSFNFVIRENGKIVGIDERKLMISDIATGDICSSRIDYRAALKEKITLLTKENTDLLNIERKIERNLRADEAMAQRRIENDTYWASPAGKIELLKRIEIFNAAMRVRINDKAKPITPIGAVKQKLRDCGITSETRAVTSIEQNCKRSLIEENIENSVLYCNMAYNCQL